MYELGKFKPTPEQLKVVQHRGGHLQVVACAGAGKTEAMSQLVADLIDEGVEPAQIIAFTFTERASASLKARIMKRVAERKGDAFLDRLGPMFVGTIHSYCLRLLQNHTPELGNHDILDEHRLAGLLSREHKRLGLNKLGHQHWRPIFDFMRNVGVVENELIDVASLSDDLGDVCRLYYETLDRYHFLTYGQLICKAVRALRDTRTHKRVHQPLRYVIVDEYQDINPAQEELIRLLGKSPVNVIVVGDDDQAIYQWRGSDVGNIISFTKQYKGAKTLPLSQNRRSRPGIIAAANAFAGTIKPRLTKAMKEHRPADGPEVHCWAAETDAGEAQKIADTIEGLVKRGFRYRDIAVLYRSVRTASPPLIEVLRDRGIPFTCAGRTGLFLQPEAAVLGRLYAWLSGNGWKNERFAHAQDIDLPHLVADFEAVYSAGKKIKDLGDYLRDWKSMVEDTTSAITLVRDYYKLLNFLGVQRWDLTDPATAARMGALARFSQILADFENVRRRARWIEENGERVFRGGADRGKWVYIQLFNYLQHYALDAYEDFEGEETFELDMVDILTVHQAKGLEWPVVFVPSLTDGRFPSRRAGESQDWLLPDSVFPAEKRRRYEGSEVEERRLFYVAMTRARDVLYLSRFERKTNRFRPSPFLLEVAGEDPRPTNKPLPMPKAFAPPTDEPDEPPTLSFSDLALYEGCPLRYRLSNLLGFEPQLVPELGYGKSIHHILRRIADETKAKKRLLTPKEISNLFDAEFYLPFANRPAFEALRDKALRLVDRYLTDHSQDLLRIWETERPFELHLPEGVVNGRADVILDRENGHIGALALVDYKTATDPRSDDVYAFQLAVYAAAGRGEGINVQAAYLHDLGNSQRKSLPVAEPATIAARKRAGALLGGVIAGSFPAQPDKKKCQHCDQRAVCGHAQCSPYEL